MISVQNYEISREHLEFQVKQRGETNNFTREDWDTFPGWKKRGRSILKGSRGFSAEIVYPFLKRKNKGKEVNGFFKS